MIGDAELVGLRMMRRGDVGWLCAWEMAERPYPWTEQHFLETVDSFTTRTLVLEDGVEPLGFAVVQVVESEAYLLNIMVRPDVRRNGRGRALLQKVCAWALSCGASDMVLDVDPSNVFAVRLYEKEGFQTMSHRARSYPRGEDALIMKRKL